VVRPILSLRHGDPAVDPLSLRQTIIHISTASGEARMLLIVSDPDPPSVQALTSQLAGIRQAEEEK
jgi:hypothetical protein